MFEGLNTLLSSRHFSTRVGLSTLSMQQKKTFSSWVIVSDFDGTFFTPDIRIVHEALYENRYITKMLRRKHIPLILNTARANITKKFLMDLFLLGIAPDTIIAGDGTVIYHKLNNDRWEKDILWEKILSEQRISIKKENLLWKDNRTNRFLSDEINAWNNENNTILRKEKGNEFLIKMSVRGIKSNTLEAYVNSLQRKLPKECNVHYSERLLPPILGRPLADLLIIPDKAGKDYALDFVLQQYYHVSNQQLTVFCFGDGIRDISSYLQMPSTQHYTLYQFLTHPTPFAKKAYESLHKSPLILGKQRGPKVMIKQLEQPLPASKNNLLRKYLTNPARHIIDRFFPQDLSATEITELGLSLIIKGVDGLYKQTVPRHNALLFYFKGHLADTADGIRSRQTIPSQRGQATDYFSDRVREFYQLYTRGNRRLKQNPQQGLITLEAALSCVLPSIVRRQAEIVGNMVTAEKDKRVLWIPTKLVFSMVYDILLHQQQRSFHLDKEILQFAQTTYNQSMEHIQSFSIEATSLTAMSASQKNAVELWLLYVEIFQEEHAMLLRAIPPELHKEYLKWFYSLIAVDILESLDIAKLRKKLGFPEYNLSLTKVIVTP